MGEDEGKNCTSVIFSCLIAALSIIIICIGPMIQGNYYKNYPYERYNSIFNIECSCYSDIVELETNTTKKNIFEKFKNNCERMKAFNIIEHIAIILDLSCAVFSIFSSFSERNDNCIGLDKIIPSFIGIVITVLYISFNGYIFNNHYPKIYRCDDLMRYTSKYSEANDYYYYSDRLINLFDDDLLKSNSEGQCAKLNQNQNYDLIYDEENDIFSRFMKFKDLKSKWVNYDKDLYFNYDDNEEYNKCQMRYVNSYDQIITYEDKDRNLLPCRHLYRGYEKTNMDKNKEIYNRWLISLILACFILLFEIINVIIGFIICKSSF